MTANRRGQSKDQLHRKTGNEWPQRVSRAIIIAKFAARDAGKITVSTNLSQIFKLISPHTENRQFDIILVVDDNH